MRGFATLTFCGSLAKDPTIRHIGSNNTKVVEFYISYGVKVGENKWDNVGIPVKVFGKMADTAESYLKKGSWVSVSGRLKQEKWEKDGEKREKYILEALDMTLMGDGKTRTESGPAQDDSPKTERTESTTKPSSGKQPLPENVFPDDEIPF